MAEPPVHATTAQLLSAAQFYLGEARYCADSTKGSVQGFATMCTAFPVVMAFGELLLGPPRPGKRHADESIIQAFCEYMPSETWLIKLAPNANRDPVQLLCELRNGMSHSLGMPTGIGFVPTTEELQAAQERGLDLAILPLLFVSAVYDAVEKIIDKNSNLDATHLFLERKRFPATVAHDSTSTAAQDPIRS